MQRIPPLNEGLAPRVLRPNRPSQRLTPWPLPPWTESGVRAMSQTVCGIIRCSANEGCFEMRALVSPGKCKVPITISVSQSGANYEVTVSLNAFILHPSTHTRVRAQQHRFKFLTCHDSLTSTSGNAVSRSAQGRLQRPQMDAGHRHTHAGLCERDGNGHQLPF